MGYFFFMSYARGTADDDVERFFTDLSNEVRLRAGRPTNEEVGFLDRSSIALGAKWPDQLVNALAECSTFLALCMPRYYLSDACGKEWWVFEERLRRYEEARKRSAPMLIPLNWIPTRRMPECVASRQNDHFSLDPAYHQDGLRQLLRLTSQQDAYITTVTKLAQHIVDQAAAHIVPSFPERLVFHEIPNSFGSFATGAPLEGTASTGQAVTSRYVHFVIAAPSRPEAKAAKLRAELDFYGDARPDWMPYRPLKAAAIADSARLIAGEESFESGVVTIDDMVDRMRYAKENNQLVVFLVDAWATRLEEHRRALVACDSWEAQNEEGETSAVLVPSNFDDRETRSNWQALSNELRQVFVNRYGRSDDRMFRTSVLSYASFDADLRVALSVAQNKMHVTGVPHRQLPEDSSTPPRPVLDLSSVPGNQ